MSFLCVCADVSLQTRHHSLVRVVRHDAHQLHAPLNLRTGQDRVHQDTESAALWFNVDSYRVGKHTVH